MYSLTYMSKSQVARKPQATPNINQANTKFDHDGISPCFELIRHSMPQCDSHS